MLRTYTQFGSCFNSTFAQAISTGFGCITVLDWFKSFLSDRSQCVRLGSARSKSIPVLQGVPQGSVLGARLYTLYVHPMSEICKRHDIHYHSYADDTQLYVHYDRNCDISMRKATTK